MSRPRLHRIPIVLLLGVLVLGIRPAQAQSSHDLQADWSNAQNPNGVWSYDFNGSPLPSNWPNWSGWGVPAWAFGEMGAPTIPAWLKIQAPPPSALLDMPMGSVLTHCTDGSVPVSVKWTCPSAAAYAVHLEVWFGGGNDPVHAGRSAFWSAHSRGVHLATGLVGWNDPYDSSNPATFSFGDDLALGEEVRIDISRNFAGNWGSFYGIRLRIGPPASIYCTAKTNSQGCLPSVSWTGWPSVSASSGFHVRCSNVVNQKNGIFIWSTTPQAVPFRGGTLCVAAPIRRTPIQSSGGAVGAPDCSGLYDFHFSPAYIASRGLVGAGSDVYGQFWSRDQAHPDGTGVGLSNAIRFEILP